MLLASLSDELQFMCGTSEQPMIDTKKKVLQTAEGVGLDAVTATTRLSLAISEKVHILGVAKLL